MLKYIFYFFIFLFTSCSNIHQDIEARDYINLKKYDYSEINKKDEYNRTPLGMAILNNDLKAIEILINKKANLSKKHDGEYPIFLSISRDIDDEIFYLLFKKLKNKNLNNSRGYTLLHQSILKREYQISKYLIENNYQSNNQNKYKRNILHLAILSQNIEIIQLILDYYPKLQYQYDVKNKVPLEYALDDKYDDISKLLIKNIDKQWRDKNKNTILHLSAKYLNANIYNYIFSNQIVDYRLKNKNKNTAEELSFLSIDKLKKEKKAKIKLEEKLAIMQEENRRLMKENDPFKGFKEVFTFKNIMKAAVITSNVYMANKSNMSKQDKIDFSVAITKDVINETGGTNLQNFKKNIQSRDKKQSTSKNNKFCKKESYPGYMEDKPQFVGNCQMAWFYSCNKEKYPNKSSEFNIRIKTHCSILNGYVSKGECPVCDDYIKYRIKKEPKKIK